MSFWFPKTVATITSSLKAMVDDLHRHADTMSDRQSLHVNKAAEHTTLADEAGNEAEKALAVARKISDLVN